MSDVPATLTVEQFNAIEAIVSDEAIKVTLETPTHEETLRRIGMLLDRMEAAAPGVKLYGQTFHMMANTAEDFQKMSRILGTFQKTADDNYFNCTRSFDMDHKLQVFTSRSNVCERRQVGVKIVPERVIPAQEIPIYEWDCGPQAKAVTKAAGELT